MHKGANLAKQQLNFTLPEGASIKPNDRRDGDIGNIYNFSEGDHSRSFTVTSEDDVWKPVYEINVQPTELPTSYHFEELLVAQNTPYHIFTNLNLVLHKGFQKYCNGPVVIPVIS